MRVRVRFTGRVQGVGFRAMTRGIARREGVVGWVRNQEDGSVLAELQGPAQGVERALGEVRTAFQGQLAGVDRADLAEGSGESDFEVRP